MQCENIDANKCKELNKSENANVYKDRRGSSKPGAPGTGHTFMAYSRPFPFRRTFHTFPKAPFPRTRISSKSSSRSQTSTTGSREPGNEVGALPPPLSRPQVTNMNERLQRFKILHLRIVRYLYRKEKQLTTPPLAQPPPFVTCDSTKDPPRCLIMGEGVLALEGGGVRTAETGGGYGKGGLAPSPCWVGRAWLRFGCRQAGGTLTRGAVVVTLKSLEKLITPNHQSFQKCVPADKNESSEPSFGPLNHPPPRPPNLIILFP